VIEQVVFLGPSLPREEAAKLLDAEYRAPAQRGDVYACLGCGVRRILLIDGLFHGVPSVWQRELLAAIDEGIEVLGASSMGALRATELLPYGMQGFGRIFEWYRDGVIDGDDEVALLHGDADSGFRPLSEPLVNIRETIARAVGEGILAREEGVLLVGEAKETFYPERSLRRLRHGGTMRGWPSDRVEAVEQRLVASRVDLKREDAREALMHCAATPISGGLRLAGSREDEYGAARARGRRIAQNVTGGDLHELAHERGVGGRLAPALARRWYALQWARSNAVVCPPGAHRAFLAHKGLPSPGEAETWLVARRVTRREYEGWLDDAALLDWLVRSDGLGAGGPAATNDPEDRLELLAREWLREWGIECTSLPDPVTLGFRWPDVEAMQLELLLAGHADTLLPTGETP
jgi:hypothetical protein